MGMSIEEHIGVIEDLKSTMSVCMPDPEKTEICASLNEAINIMRKYQKFQDQSLSLYMERLKADMVAMLTEIQLEIEELDNPLDYDFEGYNQCAVDCEKLIQQKINALKGEGENDRKPAKQA